MNYAKLVKKLREKLILFQAELAEYIGTTFGSVNRLENGKHAPTIKMKRRIVELCKQNAIEMEMSD